MNPSDKISHPVKIPHWRQSDSKNTTPDLISNARFDSPASEPAQSLQDAVTVLNLDSMNAFRGNTSRPQVVLVPPFGTKENPTSPATGQRIKRRRSHDAPSTLVHVPGKVPKKLPADNKGAHVADSLPKKREGQAATYGKRLAIPDEWHGIRSAIATNIRRQHAAALAGRSGFKDAGIELIATQSRTPRRSTPSAAATSPLVNIQVGEKILRKNALDVDQGDHILLTPEDHPGASGLFSSGFASCVMAAVASKDKQYILLAHLQDIKEIGNDAEDFLRELEEVSKQSCFLTLGFSLEAFLEDAIEERLHEQKPLQLIENELNLLAQKKIDELRGWAAEFNADLVDLPRAAVFMERGTGAFDLFPTVPASILDDPDVPDSAFWHEKHEEDVHRSVIDAAYEADDSAGPGT